MADWGAKLIQVFDDSGNWLRSWQFSDLPPYAMAARDGELYITDFNRNLVRVFTESGNLIREWNIGLAAGGAFGAYGITTGDQGRVIVATAISNRILQFDPYGTLEASWSGIESAAGPLSNPRGVYERFGSLYVVDTAGERVIRFTYPAPLQCSVPPPAGVPLQDPVILLHLTPVNGSPQCVQAVSANCATAVTSGRVATSAGPSYFAYLLVGAGASGSLGGVELGISYDQGRSGGASDGQGIEIYGWTSCGSLQFPTSAPAAWPDPSSGNRITWTAERCPNTQVGVAGYFYLGAYSASRLSVSAHPLTHEIRTANCYGSESAVPRNLVGFLAFSPDGAAPGCNPCAPSSSCPLPVPVTLTTWGNIKATYSGQR